MTTTERVWMTPQAHSRLQAELAELVLRRNTGAPDDYTGAVRSGIRARINEIHDLLTNAVVGEDPPDDGVAEPGMVLTVRYDDSGETETFLLGVRSAEVADIEVYSAQSPLGTAIAGARPGEQRSFRIPSGANVRVTLLNAVPYGTA